MTNTNPETCRVLRKSVFVLTTTRSIAYFPSRLPAHTHTPYYHFRFPTATPTTPSSASTPPTTPLMPIMLP